jgi:OOP family OmpA-OmpF porin
LGYEYVSDSTPVFESHPFVQAGFGARYPLTDRVKLVSEFKALQMVGGDDENNEFAFMIGIDVPLFVEVIRGEIDKNTRSLPDITPPTNVQTATEYQTAPSEVVVQNTPTMNSDDADNDGVPSSLDDCPNTPAGDNVNEKGCTVVSIVLPEEATYLEDGKTSTPAQVVSPVISKPVVKKARKLKSIKRQNLKVTFEPNSALIKSSSKITVKNFADFLKRDTSKSVTIEGYTDNSGQRDKNLALSKKRAQAVRSLLIKYGVSASKVEAIGKGDLNPIADNDTENGRRLNRRIEAVIH